MLRQRGRRVRAIIATLTVLVPLLSLTGTAHATTQQPGNRGYFTVAIGRLVTSKTDTGNWVRLAYYHFNTTGVVDEGFWFWSYDPNSARTTLPTHVCVADCEQYSPLGFGTAGVAKVQSGIYSISGNTVNITWQTPGNPTEAWEILDRTGMTELALQTTSYGATVGRAFGSGESSTFYAPIGAVANYVASSGQNLVLNIGDQEQWSNDPDPNWTNLKHAPSYTFTFGHITFCSETCLFMDPPPTSTDSNPSRYDFQNPSSALSRDIAMEDWKESLAQNTGCYDNGTTTSVPYAHPHVWAGLSVVDDNANWRGFVRVEYSMAPGNPEYMSVGWFTTDTLGI